jgi:hypothetical protein
MKVLFVSLTTYQKATLKNGHSHAQVTCLLNSTGQEGRKDNERVTKEQNGELHDISCKVPS